MIDTDKAVKQNTVPCRVRNGRSFIIDVMFDWIQNVIVI